MIRRASAAAVFCATAAALPSAFAQSPITISSTKLQSDFNGATGAGQNAAIAAAAFDFSLQPRLQSIDSISITLTMVDGDTGLGPNGIADTPFPPDGEEHGDDDFDVNSLVLRLDGVDLGANLLLNGFDSFQDPLGAEDYVTRTITGAPANAAALLAALQDGFAFAQVGDSTGFSQSNGFRIPLRNFGASQQLSATLSITGIPDPAPGLSLTQPVAGQVLSGSAAEFFGSAVDNTGIVKAEFFVDDVLRSTDTNSGSETWFYYGGAPANFDTTQFTNGAHFLRMRVTDTDGLTAEQQVQITIGNGADAWRAQHFAPGDANGSLSADPDRDGLPNLFEYSSNGDPGAANLDRIPQLKFVTHNGAVYPALQFVMVKWATDLEYRVEASSTLTGTWTQIDPVTAGFVVGEVDNAPAFGLKTLIVRDTIQKGTGPRFMRLRVTKH